MDEAWQPPDETEPAPVSEAEPEDYQSDTDSFADDDILPMPTRGESGGGGAKLLVGLLVLALVGLAIMFLKPAPEEPEVPKTAQAEELLEAAREYATQGQFTPAAAKAAEGLAWLEVHGDDPARLKAAREYTAELLMKAKEFEKAADEYDKLATTDPAFKAKAAEARDQANRNKRVLANEYMSQSANSFRERDFEVARRLAQTAKDLYLKYGGSGAQVASAYAMMARCYAKEDLFAEAESNMVKAVRSDGSNGTYQQELAAIRSELAAADEPDDYYYAPPPPPSSTTVVSPAPRPRYPTGPDRVAPRPRPRPRPAPRPKPQPQARPAPRPQARPAPRPRPRPSNSSGPRKWGSDRDRPPGY